ncbi:MAG TPA: arginase [Planctomycetota bacterium]|nr:arginase [Planctomycetota bacterium]
MSDAKAVGILGVPLDLGAGRRGTDMGPSAIRFAGLAERLRRLGVAVHDHGYVAAAAPETRVPGDERLRFGREIYRTCLRLRDRVKGILAAGERPVILGGDHSIAMGSVAGAAAHAEGRIGLLWIDAHADLNTPETSPTGNVHGMPFAALLGEGDPLLLGIGNRTPVILPRHAALLGVRDVDPGERARIRDLGLAVYTMKELDERGTSTCLREALMRVTKGTKGFHLSFDMDALDPEYAPGVGTPVPGGLTYREAHLACELVAESGKLLSMDVVEVNPILDERNRTADLAVQLILSALGKTIT